MKKIYLFLILMASGYLTQAQVKIGDNPTTVGASSALELESTNKALVITRVANTAAITNPVNGMMIYDISSNCVKAYENGVWTNCLSNGSNIEPSTNGTAVVSSYTCSTSSAGTLSAGVAVSGVTQTITANVTQLGTYSLNAFANGVVFSGSGTFTSLGAQTIVMTAIGTPENTGSNAFTLNTLPNCSFSRTTQGNPTSGGTAQVSAYTCTTASAGTLTAGTAVSGVTQTITATVTTAGTYNITATANGVIFTGTGTFAGTGAQTVVLTATGTPTAAGTSSFTLSTTPNCTFTRPVISVSSGGTAVVSAYSCSGSSFGTMTAGTAVSGVTQTITATVTTVGTYSISTTAINGVTFSGSGTFAGTGAQTITLTASGTPIAAGTNTFPLNITPTCSFTRSTGEAFTSSTICTTILGSYPTTQSIGGTNVTIAKTTSTDSGTVAAGGTVCSTTTTGQAIISGNSGANSVTYTFSVPVKNLQLVFFSADEVNEGMSATATLAGVSVPIQLVPFGGTCASSYLTQQNGNQASVYAATTGPSVAVNVSASGPIDSINIVRVASSAGTMAHGLSICNATAVPNSTSGGSAVVSAYNCSGASNGTLTVGTAASGVTQTITATVTTAGGYNISVPAVNGVSWSGSGTFAGTGSQTITLTASGTPTTAGTSTFALNGTPTCSFTRSVGTSFTSTICTTGFGSFPTTQTVGGTSVTITKTTNADDGSWSGTDSVCSASISGQRISLNTGQSVTYAFSVPLRNLQISMLGIDELNEGFSITASLAGVAVPVQLVPFGGTCASGYSTSQSGNTASAFATGSSASNAVANISSNSAYDTLTVTRIAGAAGSGAHGLLLCNATAVPNATSGGSAIVSAYNCSGTSAGTLAVGLAASGVTQTITATVTTAGGYTISTPVVNGISWSGSGTFAGTGSQTITLTASGTPTSAGTSTFSLNSTPSCSFSRTIASSAANNCNTAIPTAIVEVTSATGRIWMDRNLGATRAATSATDTQAYGSLYQWGRASDGHQCVNRYSGDGVTNSPSTTTLATTDTPGNNVFIRPIDVNPGDWRSDNNSNRWNAASFPNNPCPSGYLVPTISELTAERASWTNTAAASAYASPLKLSLGGNRFDDAGASANTGIRAWYWSRSVSGTGSPVLVIDTPTNSTSIETHIRRQGFSVRCIKAL